MQLDTRCLEITELTANTGAATMGARLFVIPAEDIQAGDTLCRLPREREVRTVGKNADGEVIVWLIPADGYPDLIQVISPGVFVVVSR